MKVYHGTSSKLLWKILQEGFIPKPDPLVPAEKTTSFTDDPYYAEWYAHLKCYGKDILMPITPYIQNTVELNYLLAFWKIANVGGIPCIVVVNMSGIPLRQPEEYKTLNSVLSADKPFQQYVCDVHIPKERIVYYEFVRDSVENIMFAMFRPEVLDVLAMVGA